MECNKCKHKWNYKGNSKRVTCPNCHTKLKVDNSIEKSRQSRHNKQEIGQLDSELGQLDSEMTPTIHYEKKLKLAISNNNLFMISYYKEKIQNLNEKNNTKFQR